MGGTTLAVRNLAKGDILHGVSFDLSPGEMLAIMGPSGSGKSTLLHNVATLDSPDEGSIRLGETELTALDEDEKAAVRLRRLGFVFQQMNMLAGLSILDNILLPAWHAARKSKEQSREELHARASRLMEKLGVESLAPRRISEVSGGELQRACICRAMMNRPEVLFADEPTGALNRAAAEGVMAQMAGIVAEGTSLLVVTHDAHVAASCQRVLYLLDGRLRGELDFGAQPAEDMRGREQAVSSWLARMGW